MTKAKMLFDLILYVNARRRFTAEEVAHEFGVSVRTAHRYLAELSGMGVPLYTEPGRHGGYRVLGSRMLPPVLMNESEAFAIFFAFQSLKYYRSLPFGIDIASVSRKLYASLPPDARQRIDRLDAVLSFWNKKRGAPSPYLREIMEAASDKRVLEIRYQSARRDTNREVAPIGVYAYDGYWYMPAVDLDRDEIRVFRLDRILELRDTGKTRDPGIRLDRWLDNLTDEEPGDPVRLYAELTREGVRRCLSQPWLEPHVRRTDDGRGYVDMMMDRSEIAFAAAFFLQLGTDAKVVRPAEVTDRIREKLREMMAHYGLVSDAKSAP